MLSLNSLHVHGIVRNNEIELLATLRVRDAAKDWGHFRLFGTLAIGHIAHPGAHRLTPSAELAILLYYGANREDFAESCWSGRQGLREQSSRQLQTAVVLQGTAPI